MNSLSNVSLDDTLNLVQLMRETALAQNRETQANKLTPVVDQMRELAITARKTTSTTPASKGMFEQADFKKLLETTQADNEKSSHGNTSGESSGNAALQRNRLAAAMSSADMSEVEIARQLGMTREEVGLVLNLNARMKIT